MEGAKEAEMATTQEVGDKLVQLCRAGKSVEAVLTLYSGDAVSVEAMSSPEMPAVTDGRDAIRGKNEWWYANNEVHSSDVRGPLPNGDKFAVIFAFEFTPKAGPWAGKRQKMEEVGLYTVKDGRIVREEFFYSMA
jgi:hypothetical protein